VPALRFRPARAADGVSLHVACFPDESPQRYAARFQRALRAQQRGDRLVLLACEASPRGPILGTGQLILIAQGRAEIAELHVRADRRSEGVGSALLTVLERVARHAGCRKLEIVVSGDNERAQRLYRQMGYTQSRELQVPQGYSAFLLTKAL
jgi:ribosomal protein S18 acetylase RimI-like enzyme